MRYLVALALALAASGCASSTPGEGEALMSAGEIRAKDEGKCRSYGIAPGTDPFSACLMKQDEIRAGVQSSNTAAATAFIASRYGR